MNAAALRRFWSVLWHLSGSIVVLAGLAAAFWIYSGGGNWPATSFFDPALNQQSRLMSVIFGIGLPVWVAWTFLGANYARLLVGAGQLCIPGLASALHGSLSVLAVATIGGTALLGAALNGPLSLMLAVCSDAILLGLIAPLFSGASWIWIAGIQIPVFAVIWGGTETPAFSAVAWALTGPLMLVWGLRRRSLTSLASVGASNSSLRLLQALPVSSSSGMWWIRAAPLGPRLSPDRTIRVILGPRYDTRAMLWSFFLAFAWAAVPWGMWLIVTRNLHGHVYDDWLTLVRNSTFDMAFAAIGFMGGGVATRLSRLAELFRATGGELPELALLPGFGDERRMRAGLVWQALTRPALWVGLGLGLSIGGSVFSRLLLDDSIPAGPPAELLIALPVMSLLLSGIVTGLSVMTGLFDKAMPWRHAALPVALILLNMGSFQVKAFSSVGVAKTVGPPAWLWGIWVLVLVGLAAALLVMTVRWKQRRHVFCR